MSSRPTLRDALRALLEGEVGVRSEFSTAILSQSWRQGRRFGSARRLPAMNAASSGGVTARGCTPSASNCAWMSGIARISFTALLICRSAMAAGACRAAPRSQTTCSTKNHGGPPRARSVSPAAVLTAPASRIARIFCSPPLDASGIDEPRLSKNRSTLPARTVGQRRAGAAAGRVQAPSRRRSAG